MIAVPEIFEQFSNSVILYSEKRKKQKHFPGFVYMLAIPHYFAVVLVGGGLNNHV